jgi:ElaB/YqjD/DUF883 family membrane-anchored ribosome-binding protein
MKEIMNNSYPEAREEFDLGVAKIEQTFLDVGAGLNRAAAAISDLSGGLEVDEATIETGGAQRPLSDRLSMLFRKTDICLESVDSVSVHLDQVDTLSDKMLSDDPSHIGRHTEIQAMTSTARQASKKAAADLKSHFGSLIRMLERMLENSSDGGVMVRSLRESQHAIASNFAIVIQNMQLGDITRQRWEHVQSILIEADKQVDDVNTQGILLNLASVQIEASIENVSSQIAAADSSTLAIINIVRDAIARQALKEDDVDESLNLEGAFSSLHDLLNEVQKVISKSGELINTDGNSTSQNAFDLRNEIEAISSLKLDVADSELVIRNIPKESEGGFMISMPEGAGELDPLLGISIMGWRISNLLHLTKSSIQQIERHLIRARVLGTVIRDKISQDTTDSRPVHGRIDGKCEALLGGLRKIYTTEAERNVHDELVTGQTTITQEMNGDHQDLDDIFF